MPTLLLDLRQALRSLLHAPGFALTAVACLALGLGANLAVLSHLDRLVLRPLPFPGPSRLAVLEPVNLKTGETGPMTMADFLDLKDQCKGFQAMDTCTARVRTLTGRGEPTRLDVGMVTANFFEVLGVKPALGRTVFRTEEEVMPASVAVLRHDLWMSRFGGDPKVLGQTVVLDGNPLRIVGVLPVDFRFYARISQAQVFTPEATPFAGRDNRGMGTFLTLGRLAPHTSLSAANAEAHAIGSRITASFGHPEFSCQASSLLDKTAQGYRQTLLIFQGAVALVLLITCFNVASLQLVRNMARGRELAVRQALGAGQHQMIRLFLAESLLLALAGGALGIGLSFYLQQGLGWLVKDLSPTRMEASIYPALLAAAVGLSLLTGLGLTLLSWLMARRPRLVETLKGGARGGHSLGHWRTLKALVVGEVSLSVMLMLGAGLLIHTLLNLRGVHPGFEARHVLTVDVPLPAQKYTLPVQRAFLQRLEPALKVIPGVQDVGVNDTLPFVKAVNGGYASPVAAGREKGRDTLEIYFRWHVVSPGYFRTLSIPVLAGQVFSPADTRACMVSRRLAEHLWPGQDPLGRPVYTGLAEPLVVSGVVGDTAENDLSRHEDPQLYISAETHELQEGPVVVLKVQGDPARYATAVKAAIRALDLDLAVPEPLPLMAALRASNSMVLASVSGILFSAFGTLALLLSSVGLYGVLSQVTQQRRREIGIRMSLGATQSSVVGSVISSAAGLVGLGLVLGSLLGWELSRTLDQLLFGLKTPGPVIYLGVLALLAPSALLACLLPALRAARTDPAEVLRSE